jgi:outer membrane beta-barrel protein
MRRGRVAGAIGALGICAAIATAAPRAARAEAGVGAPPAPAFAAAPAEKARGQVRTMVKLDRGDNNVVRSGPGAGFAICGLFPKDAAFPVIAKSGDWYNVRLSDTETGWVHASLCKEYDDLSHLEFRPNPRLFSRIGSFVVTGYAGGYAFDRKSNSLVLGGRLSYYVLDFLEVEGGLGWTHIVRPQEIVESLFDLSLEAEDFHMLFYQMNVNLELMPGRQIVPYVSGGVGSSILRGRTEPSVNFGGGTRFFVRKTLAMRWECRSYRFESGSDDARRRNSNIEFSMGTSVLF